jgi:hypothetical protein
MFSAVTTTYSLPSCSITLPLRIELAMTLKAVFPACLARLGPGGGQIDGGPGAPNQTAAPVSGRNILVLPLDASVLLANGAVG